MLQIEHRISALRLPVVGCRRVDIAQLGAPCLRRFIVVQTHGPMGNLPEPVRLKILLRHFQIIDGPKAAVAHRGIAVQYIHPVDPDAVIVEAFLYARHFTGPPAVGSLAHGKTAHAPDVYLHRFRAVGPQPEPGPALSRIQHLCPAMLVPVLSGGPALFVHGQDQPLVDGIEHQHMLRVSLKIQLLPGQYRLLICKGLLLPLRCLSPENQFRKVP